MNNNVHYVQNCSLYFEPKADYRLASGYSVDIAAEICTLFVLIRTEGEYYCV